MRYNWEQIEDYLHCPFYYAFKWEMKKTGQPKEKHLLKAVYLDSLKQIASYTFHMVGGERYPTWFDLKRKWEKVWVGSRDEKKLMNENMFNYNRRNTYRQYEKKGLKALLKFHEDFTSPGFPILINKDLHIDVNNKKLQVPIDFIRQQKDGTIELTQWSVESTVHDFHIKHNMLLTAQSYAFKKATNFKDDLKLSIYSFHHKPIHTKRTKEQYKVFEHTVETVIDQIESRNWYPRYTENCNECPFKNMCDKEGHNLL